MTGFNLLTGCMIIALLLAGCATPQSVTPGIEPAVAPAGPTDSLFLPATPTIEQPPTELPTQPEPTTATATQTLTTSPTALCSSPADLTPAATEGPYYTPNSPERNSLLEAGMSGTLLTLTGYVLTSDCQPVTNAWLDFWQADSHGVYDNSGYRLRGRQFTDANGRYRLETVVPGLYPGRTEHIHVKVQSPNGPILTTQLFFPEVSGNQSDQIYDPTLLIALQESSEGLQGAFNFIIGP